jgi:hypothetical protein
MASNVVCTAEMDAAEQAAPLDALLVDAALGPLRRFTPDASTARGAVRLARHPRTTGRRIAALGGELAKAVAGTSTVALASGPAVHRSRGGLTPLADAPGTYVFDP